jgi:hypothetical protein
MKKVLFVVLLTFCVHAAYSQWHNLTGYVQPGPDYTYDGYLDFDLSPDNSIYVVYRYSGYSIHYTYFRTAKSVDGGLNWTFPGIGPTATLYKIQCVAQSQLVTFVTDQMTSAIRTTTDDFLTCENIPGSLVDGYFNAYDFIDISRGFALNDFYGERLGKVENGVYSSTPGDSVNFAYGSVKILNDTTAFILCRDLNYASATTPGNNMLIKTTDFGATWSTIFKDTLYNLNHFTFIDEDKGILVGKEGIILQTSDGGYLWDTMNSGINSNINHIYSNNNINFCVGNNGLILRNYDGETEWENISFGTMNYTKIKTDVNNYGYILAEGQYPDEARILVSDFVLSNSEITENDDFLLYPNPSSGQLYYSCSNINNLKEIRLQNLSGQLVLTVTGGFNEHLDVSDLDSGIYFITFDLGNQSIAKKLVIISR